MKYIIEFENLHTFNTALTALFTRQQEKRDILEKCKTSIPYYPAEITRLEQDIDALSEAIESFRNYAVKSVWEEA